MTILVWDIDDVLNELTAQWLATISHNTISTKHQLTNPDFHTFLGWSRDEYLHSIDNYRLDHYRDLAPNELVIGFMSETQFCSHILLTATPLISAPHSAEWALRHFGSLIDGILIAPSTRPGVQSTRMSKLDHIARITATGEAVLCIDDLPANITQAHQSGAEGILWPQPWNNSSSTIDSVLNFITTSFLRGFQ